MRHLGAKPARTHVRAALEFLDLQMLYARDDASDSIAVPDSASLVETVMEEEPEVVMGARPPEGKLVDEG